MANKKISELNEATSVNDNDVLPIVQSGETKKIKKQTLFGNGTDNVFIAVVQQTLYANILSAYNNGKHIILRENLEDGTVRFFPLDGYNPDSNFFDFKTFTASSPTGFQQITGWQVNGNNVWTPVLMNLAKLGSPAFTGTPTAPTAPIGTNTTQIATTAFVHNAITEALQNYQRNN